MDITRMVAVMSMITITTAMNAQNIILPAAKFSGGMPVNEAIANRHSTREYDPTRDIDMETLGQLLWMSLGVNRPDAKPARNGAANRTNPTALNRQEVHAYLFGREGVWEYEPATHSLRYVVDGDHRSLLAGTKEFKQDFVMDAPYAVLFVADLTGLPTDDSTKMMAMIDVGIASENLSIGCASLGIATVPRATMDNAAVSALLGLTPQQLPVLNAPLAYPR